MISDSSIDEPSLENASPIAEGGEFDLIRQEASKSMQSVMNPDVAGSNDRQSSVIRMATEMSKLSYEDYLVLDGIIKDLVKSSGAHSLQRLSDNTELSDNLKNIYLELAKNSDLSNYATAASLLLRRSYTFGTNIVNKYWDESEGPFGFDAARPGVIKATRATEISFFPGEDTTSCTIKAEGKEAVLKEGVPFIIGRPFRNINAFDANIDASISTDLPIDNDLTFSRTSIMLILKGGTLYVFDKGSRNSISGDQDNFHVEYDTHRAEDGSFGHSNASYTERSIDENF